MLLDVKFETGALNEWPLNDLENYKVNTTPDM